ncbi:E3 ubiquitin-protein ligase RNF130 isoform X1, partial [Silurus meridionalis]
MGVWCVCVVVWVCVCVLMCVVVCVSEVRVRMRNMKMKGLYIFYYEKDDELVIRTCVPGSFRSFCVLVWLSPELLCVPDVDMAVRVLWRTDKTDKTVVNKEEYYSATINATVQDSRGNTKRVISKEDGRYGQNSPKTEVKGIIITPAAVNGARSCQVCLVVCLIVCLVVSVVVFLSGVIRRKRTTGWREELWYCMRKSGVSEKYVRVVQDMYEDSVTAVKCAVGTTDWFKMKVGLLHGSALSPFMFTVVIDRLKDE